MPRWQVYEYKLIVVMQKNTSLGLPAKEANEEAIREVISLANLSTRIVVKGAQEGMIASLCQKSAVTKLMSESLPSAMSISQQKESVP